MPPSGRNMNPEVGGEGGGRRRRGRGRREILAGGWWQRAPNLAKRRRKRGRGGKNWERATMAHFWRASLNDPNDVVLLARYEQMGWSPPQLQRTHPHTHTPPLTHTHTHTHTWKMPWNRNREDCENRCRDGVAVDAESGISPPIFLLTEKWILSEFDSTFLFWLAGF